MRMLLVALLAVAVFPAASSAKTAPLCKAGQRTTKAHPCRPRPKPAAAAPAPVVSQKPPATPVSVGAPCDNPSATTVKVSIFDFGFTLSQTTVPCGTVTFQIVNTGAIFHNFDVAAPTASGTAALAGAKILAGGETTTQTVDYARSGTYPYQCDLHWIQGQMIGVLTVTQ